MEPAAKQTKKRKIAEISSSSSEDEVKRVGAGEDKKKRIMKEGAIEKENDQQEQNASSNNKMKRIIVWLRNDLRVHDNPVLDWAAKYGGKTKEILPVYSIDPRFTTRKVEKYDTQKCGPLRARFLLETLENLRTNLEALGSHLLITLEKPEVFLPLLISENADNTLVY